MSITQVHLPRNTSSLCRHLASSAANLFANQEEVSTDPASLQNIYRLLEMYRFDAFVDLNAKGVLELGEAGAETDIDETDGQALKRALNAARNTAYPGLETETVVTILERHISEIARNPHEAVGINPAESVKAKRFFEELANSLAHSP